ncbi:hypothetical protein [Streptomyces sp. NPDC002644]
MSTPAAPATGDTGAQASDPSSVGQEPSTQGDPTTPATPEAPPAPEPVKPGEDPTAAIARLQNELAKARAEAGKVRVTAKERAAEEARQSLAAQLMSVLDPEGATTKAATPEQLQELLTAEQARARQTAVELAVYRAAATAGADPDALLDSRSFAAAVADLDPSDSAGITAAITAAVQANPRYALAPAGPTRGGTEFSAQPQTITAEQFAAMGNAERVQLFQNDPDTYARLTGR